MKPVDHGRTEISLLYVEDDPNAREMVSRVLAAKYSSLELHTAENGSIGLELFKKHRPDIVLTDISMPISDGIQMARHIRAFDSQAIIIVISACSDSQYLLDAIKIGVGRYVMKPIDHKLLFEAIDDCITRITLERQVKEQNDFIRKLSRAVEQSPNTVVMTDTSGTIEYVNSKFTELTGFSYEEALGQNPRIMKSAFTTADIYENLWSTITAGMEWHGEFLNRKKNGEHYWEAASISPLYNEEGIITHYIGVKEDITERKRLEEELRLANAELEKRVAERTAELTETLDVLQKETAERLHAMEALREKEQLLMHQSRLAAMGEMINNIAHQWRQPLNTISLLVQVLRDANENGKCNVEFMDETVNQIMNLILHMSQTVDDFRNFFRPDREKKQFDLSESVNKALILVGDSLKADNIIVERDTQEDIIITGYPNEFSQVLLNIFNNARDALIERNIVSPKITVSLRREGRRAVATISDNAGGIPDKIIGRVFEPYFTTKDAVKGTGIGLHISKTIIERRMNGKISVSNNYHGAEFRIEI